ncbi:C4-dicarboxylate transporter DctA [Salmonella enterica subsp. arizonae]|uniref:C4-dicarboxylate transporter DctA n=1 Tax=Salmonella enterica subsp. arizonae TaxID=59203 RepID=A0A3S4G3D0_SALER|nr:C4-dicarboxylate transporter DctA [Salmonella enterica subsp. arizonae]
MKTSLFKSLYFQVLTAIAIGILLGHYYPELGAQMKPLGDAFVKLIKMIIASCHFLYCRDGHRRHGKHESGGAVPAR